MSGAAQMLTVRVPLAVRKRGGRKLVVTPGGLMNRGQSGADSTLVKALARAFRWRRMMETSRFATLNELAAAEKINSSYVSRMLRLAEGLTAKGFDLTGATPEAFAERVRAAATRWPGILRTSGVGLDRGAPPP